MARTSPSSGEPSTNVAATNDPAGEVTREQVDAMLHACRSLVAIAVRSLSAVASQVDLVELRILVVIASNGPASLGQVAAATAIHLSKASRACDRLVARDLLARDDNPSDRRHLRLTLTPTGRRIVQRVMQARRAAIIPMLGEMDERRRTELVTALHEFTSGSEPADQDLWAVGWRT